MSSSTNATNAFSSSAASKYSITPFLTKSSHFKFPSLNNFSCSSVKLDLPSITTITGLITLPISVDNKTLPNSELFLILNSKGSSPFRLVSLNLSINGLTSST